MLIGVYKPLYYCFGSCLITLYNETPMEVSDKTSVHTGVLFAERESSQYPNHVPNPMVRIICRPIWVNFSQVRLSLVLLSSFIRLLNFYKINGIILNDLRNILEKCFYVIDSKIYVWEWEQNYSGKGVFKNHQRQASIITGQAGAGINAWMLEYQLINCTYCFGISNFVEEFIIVSLILELLCSFKVKINH